MFNHTLTLIYLIGSIATSFTAGLPAMQPFQNNNEEQPNAHCTIQPVTAELLAWASPAHDPTGQPAKQPIDRNHHEQIILTTELRLHNTSTQSQEAELISLEWSAQGRTSPRQLDWMPTFDLSPLNQFTDNTRHLISAKPESLIRVSTTLKINHQTCTLHTSLKVPTTPH
jgi:hypothetical protein